MEQIARPEGLFAIFKVIQYIPYIAIGLLLIMIAMWIVFGIKKLRWAKIMAIMLTMLVVITGLLSFTPYIMGAITGRQLPMGGIFRNKDFPAGDREQFQDFRERQDNKKSGLDIETNFQFVEVNGEFITL
jgi:hypothetical protein